MKTKLSILAIVIVAANVAAIVVRVCVNWDREKK